MIRKENIFEILNPSNPQQLANTNLTGQALKVSDKYSQSELLSLSKNGKISIPRTNRQHLNLLTPFIIFQMFIPHSKSFNLELTVLDSSMTRRKLIFTTCRGVQKDPLHSKITNSSFPRDY